MTEADVLPCGRSVAALVDQADAGRLEPADAHQAGCPHCRASLRDAARADRALALLRGQPEDVPSDLVDRVLRGVREARPGGPDLLDLPASSALGRLRVGRQLLADVARVAAAALPGVTVVQASVVAGGSGIGEGLRVSLGLVVDGRTPLPELAVRVRAIVRAALLHAVGARGVDVDLTALDVVGPDLSSAAAQLPAPDGV